MFSRLNCRPKLKTTLRQSIFLACSSTTVTSAERLSRGRMPSIFTSPQFIQRKRVWVSTRWFDLSRHCIYQQQHHRRQSDKGIWIFHLWMENEACGETCLSTIQSFTSNLLCAALTQILDTFVWLKYILHTTQSPFSCMTHSRPFCRVGWEVGLSSKARVRPGGSQPVHSLWARYPWLPMLPLFYLPIKAAVKSSWPLGGNPFSWTLPLCMSTLWKDIYWKERLRRAQFR